jgi:hypothetical protein
MELFTMLIESKKLIKVFIIVRAILFNYLIDLIFIL